MAVSSATRTPSELDTYLERAAVESERLRTAVLGVVAGIGLVLSVVLPTLVESRGLPVPRLTEGLRGMPAVALTLSLIVLELGAHAWARHRAQGERSLPSWMGYGMVALEVSLLTVALALSTRTGLSALISPLTFAYFVIVGLTVLRLDPGIALFAGVLAGAEYVTVAILALSGDPGADVSPDQLAPFYYIVRAAVLVLMGVASAFVAWELRRRVADTWAQIAERERVRRSFGEHADPAVVDVILEAGGVVAGERRKVCVMFLDLRGYSSFADGRDPSEVVDLLNRFFGICIPLVTGAGGVVHQLLGDGLMAIFGAPIAHDDDERRALSCGAAIVDAVAAAVDSGALPPVDVGIGIHSGTVVAGSIGTTSHREYKVTGDVVNMASRIEALTKDMGVPLLASSDVWHVADHPELTASSRGFVELRGHQAPIEVFAVGH